MIKLSADAMESDDPNFGIDSLTLVEKILLGCDGTFTNLVETLSREAVEVRKIAESEIVPDSGRSGNIEFTQPVLVREVVLQGADSEKPYIHARTIVFTDNLAPAIKRALQETSMPIGAIWDEFQVETYKRMLKWGEIRMGRLCHMFDLPGDSRLLFRTYSVTSSSVPIMKITESFPRRWFAATEEMGRIGKAEASC